MGLAQYNMKIENKKLIRKIQKRGISYIVIFLVVGALLIGCALYLDNREDVRFRWYRYIVGFVNVYSEDLKGILLAIKCAIMESAVDYCNMVVTYNTILAAAVIFFYSILENRRGGISHRTLIAYSFGSWLIPVLFSVTLLLVPMMYVVKSLKLQLTTIACILYIFCLQIMIIFVILKSASFNNCIRFISYVEICQYEILNKEIEKSKYIWLYLVRHLEQVIKSNELTLDKIRVVRSLLWVPFYKKNIFWGGFKIQNSAFKYNDLDCLYRFYYENLTVVFRCLSKEENGAERREIYLVLYEFLEKFGEQYQKLKKCNNRWNDCKKRNQGDLKKMCDIYQMVISAIMNAALSSKIAEREAFCNYIFNNCITDDSILIRQLNLYILFQEAMNAIDISDNAPVNMKGISCLNKWKKLQYKESGSFAMFWYTWMNLYTIPIWKRIEHFERAYDTLTGYSNASEIITGIIIQIEQR